MRTVLIAVLLSSVFQAQAVEPQKYQFVATGEGYWCYQDKSSAYQQALFMMKQNAAAECAFGRARQTTPVSEITGPCSVEVRAGFVCR